jgi:hypothetical protein
MALNPYALYSAAEDCSRRGRVRLRFSNIPTRGFSVYQQTEGGTLSHGLATALINRDGRIERIWRGNAWTPAEVTEAIQAETK